jgi:peroxiredoxin
MHGRGNRLVAVTAALPTLLLAVPAQAAGPLAGTWRVVLAQPGGDLPFGLELSTAGGTPRAVIVNPPERLRVESVRIEGDTLILAFPSYGSQLVLRVDGAGGLSGEARLVRRSGQVVLPARATRAGYRFSVRPKASGTVSGSWIVETGGERPQTGLAQFRQDGAKVTGSIQFPTGDTRYLAGDLNGDQLRLSTFDGNAASLWQARLVNGTLNGAQFGAASATGTPFTARPAGTDTVKAVAVEKVAPQRIAIRFPGSDGRIVSLSDPRFRGKVVVVTLGGTWCPNCHDEARFLGPYAAKREKEGLEVIGLQFEYGDDPARAFRQVDSFKARYQLPYALLLAGQPTPESTKTALPMIGGVKVYPSTLFIGRDGTLREVHVGWAGPATGPLNARAKADFDKTVSRLLAEGC